MEPIKYVRAWDELSSREQAEFIEAIVMHRACDVDLGFPFAFRDDYCPEIGKCLYVGYFDPEKNQTYYYHYKYWKDAWPDSWPKAEGSDWHWW